MGFLVIIGVIIIAALFSDSSGGYYTGGGFDDDFSGSTGTKSSFNGFSLQTHRRESFEEADSFYDHEGNEHILDDYGYCDDCDDYHDD